MWPSSTSCRIPGSCSHLPARRVFNPPGDARCPTAALHLSIPWAGVTDIAAICTACGACADACPTLAVAGFDGCDTQAPTSGVRDILRLEEGAEAGKQWSKMCCGSGNCLTVCPEGINPRFMLTIARRALSQANPEPKRRGTGKAAFQKMSRGVRVLSRLSLPPYLLEKLSPRPHPERDEVLDMVFYTGCNMLKTPHIGLLCLDVIEALGFIYEVQGGPSACCSMPSLNARRISKQFRTNAFEMWRSCGVPA